jgi:predicted nucleic acid-binding Zn ribbon protein
MSFIDEDPDESDMDSTDEESAEIECPYCGEVVPEFVQRCPNCGNYISQEGAPRRRPAWWILIGVIVALIGTLMWLFL